MQNDFKKKLLSNLMSLFTLQGLNYLLPLLTFPYLVRVLGAEKYGLMMFAQSVIQYFLLIVDFGFNLSATRYISVHRDDPKKVASMTSSVFIVKFFLILFCAALLAALLFFSERFRNEKELYINTFGLVVSYSLFPIWFFQGMEKMKFITIVHSIAKILFTLLIFVWVKEENDYALVPLINTAGYGAAGLYAIYIVSAKFGVRLRWPGRAALADCMKDSAQFFLSRAAVSAYTNSNTFVLGLFLGDLAAGLYSAAEKLYTLMLTFYNIASDVLYPHIAKTKDLSFYKKAFLAVNGLNLLSSGLCFLFAGQIISLVYGPGFEQSVFLFKLFCIAAAVTVPAVLLGYPLLGAMGHAAYANYSVVAASVLHIALLAVLFPVLSLELMPVLLIINQTAVIAIRLYGVQKKLRIKN